tara:strand:+ start:574 stop:756 length:183 start_codon:yes stop_codon:yes gene_type:complete
VIYSPFSGDACDVRVNLYASLLVLFDINRIASSAIGCRIQYNEVIGAGAVIAHSKHRRLP